MELGDRVPKVGGGTMSVAGALAWAVRHAGVAAQYARLTYERVRAVEAGDAALAAKLDTQAASLAAQLEGIEQKLDSLAEPEEETT